MSTLPDHISDALRELVRPMRRLTAKDLAKRWQMHSKTVLEIPEEDLPRCRVGPRKGRVMFREVDVQRYEIGLSPIDWDEFGDEIVPARRQPSMVILDRDKPTRVI